VCVDHDHFRRQKKKTKNEKTTATLLAAGTLSACNQYSEITTAPQDVNYTRASAAEAVIGVRETKVRTTTVDAEGKRQDEILAANCNMQGPGFESTF